MRRAVVAARANPVVVVPWFDRSVRCFVPTRHCPGAAGRPCQIRCLRRDRSHAQPPLGGRAWRAPRFVTAEHGAMLRPACRGAPISPAIAERRLHCGNGVQTQIDHRLACRRRGAVAQAFGQASNQAAHSAWSAIISASASFGSLSGCDWPRHVSSWSTGVCKPSLGRKKKPLSAATCNGMARLMV